ncbi:ADP-ribosylglycohydrolase-domain-containing protein [Mycena albidolilacea]|uniref:ADP-ribosylglycohydrolase-domain-containing protein n=1 Tax=Mycena albidolilacea TaxID=1033008 RepID=A0AAD6ZVL2_9AGAR|nr:ADP-ribosylglycohydrolase-domain-containing protein [Mycena albidolilacea]
MNDSKILDRAEGALFGSALGDAIGIYTEFMTDWQALEAYGSSSPNFTLIPPETKLHNDTHRCRFESRAWTDDTDHTILMMLSYLRLRELSPKDFAIRLHSWCSQGLRVLDRLPMGLGKTVGSVVFSPSYTDDPAGTALSHWDKNGRKIAPNGSLMRTTPVGVICIPKTEEETFAAAIRMGAVTHADPRCALSVAIVSALVRALCLGQIAYPAQVRELIERAWDYVQRTQPPEHAALLDRAEFVAHAYAESLEALVLCDRAMGYVYKCLGAALWCLRRVLTHQDTFRSAMTALVMFGGDADTNGAVAGALMGALCGCEYLPKEWRDGMRHAEWYRAKVQALCCVAGLRDGVYDSESDADTELDGGKGFITEEEMKKREMGIMERMLLSEKERREKAEAKVKAQTKSSSWKSWLSGS